MDHLKDIFGTLFKEFRWLILGLAGIGVVWFASGGTANETAHQGAYIKPLAPLDSGRVYGTYYVGRATDSREDQLKLPQYPAAIIRKTESIVEGFFEKSKKAEEIHTNSLLAHKIYIDGVAGAEASKPEREYIRLVVDPKAAAAVQITGLSLQGTAFDGKITIPRGVSLHTAGATNKSQDIVLAPGERAIISSGVSPVGYSFRVNICSGYLNSSATYVPALRNECPSNPSCKQNPLLGMTYAACVDAHKSDDKFFANEWRVFLGQNVELWRNSSEIIKLVDSQGNVVDALTY